MHLSVCLNKRTNRGSFANGATAKFKHRPKVTKKQVACIQSTPPPWRINPKFKIESVDKSLEEILSILQKLEAEIVWSELNIDYTLLPLPLSEHYIFDCLALEITSHLLWALFDT